MLSRERVAHWHLSTALSADVGVDSSNVTRQALVVSVKRTNVGVPTQREKNPQACLTERSYAGYHTR